MWFATLDGLCRYDGYDIKCYYPFIVDGQRVQNKIINSLFCDSDNNIWVATTQGLFRFNPRSEMYSAVNHDELSSLNVQFVREGLNGDLWIAAEHRLYLYSKSGELYEPITAYLGDRDDWSNISALLCDSRGNIWIGYRDDGVVWYDPSGDRYIIEDSNELVRDSVISFYEDHDGLVYYGVWRNGLWQITDVDVEGGKISAQKSKISTIDKSFNNSLPHFVIRDSLTGSYWIGTARGLFLTDNLANPTAVRHIESGARPDDLANSEVTSVYYNEDEESLWFGTLGGGVNKTNLNPPPIVSVQLRNIKDRYGSNEVRAIYDDGDRLWVGIKSAGFAISEYGDGGMISMPLHYSEFDAFEDFRSTSNSVNVITALKSHNEVWLGTRYSGVAVVNLDESGAPVSIYHLDDDKDRRMNARYITAIYEDADGGVWVGTNYGLFYCDRILGEWRITLTKSRVGNDVVPRSRVVAITGDTDGNIWIATKHNGIFKVVERDELLNVKLERYRIDTSDGAFNSIETIFGDSNGRIWVGTSGMGLLHYDSNRGLFVPENEAVFGQIATVNSIVEGDNGTIWFGTNGGLYGYNVDSLTGEYTLQHYTYEDGLAGNTTLANSIYKNHKGEILLGGYNGFSFIRPQHIQRNSYRPNISITDVKVMGESILYPNIEGAELIERSGMGDLSELTIPYDKNTFSIEFSSLSFATPTKNRYQYKLEGYSDNWTDVDSEHRMALYSNLDWGHYTFRVRGTNDSNLMSERDFVLHVVVERPAYASWWAILIYIVVVISTLALIIVNVVLRVRLNNRLRLEYLEKKKSDEVSESKLSFFTNVSHEFLTPLTIISCGLSDLEITNPTDVETHTIMRNNVSRLMRMLEQILEFRKADSDNLRLKVRYGDIAKGIRELSTENFTPLIKQRKYEFTVECVPEALYGWFDSDKLDKILYNLISNAIKYNVDGGFIKVRLKGLKRAYEDAFTRVEISVRNSGSVIPEDQLENLFKRFYVGNSRPTSGKGVGIGLSLTYDLVKLHRGNIEVDSNALSGTCFTIELPIDVRFYTEDQIDRSAVEGESGALITVDLEDLAALEQSENEEISENEEVVEVAESVDDDELDSATIEEERPLPLVLFVEDDVELSKMMGSLLHRYYRVEQAVNGVEGYEKAHSLLPDIIVSDVMMDQMDGLEMCRRLKDDPATSHIPIILLSARIGNEDKVDGLSVGAQAYLTKPIQLKVLTAQIESLLANHDLIESRMKQRNIAIQQVEYSSVDERFLERAVEVVNDNIDNSDFDVKGFIELMGMTNSMLYRKLKTLTGLSPNEFIRSIRLKAAHKLITEKFGSITISEVAYTVGFNIPKYFTSCFKKEYGLTPSQYRDKLLNGQKK